MDLTIKQSEVMSYNYVYYRNRGKTDCLYGIINKKLTDRKGKKTIIKYNVNSMETKDNVVIKTRQ